MTSFIKQNQARYTALMLDWEWSMDTYDINGIHVLKDGIKTFPADGYGLWW